MLRNLQFNALKQGLKENIQLLQKFAETLEQPADLQEIDLTSLTENQRHLLHLPESSDQLNIAQQKILLEQSIVAHESLFRVLDKIFSPQYLSKESSEETEDERLEIQLKAFHSLDSNLAKLIDKFVQLEPEALPRVLPSMKIVLRPGGVKVEVSAGNALESISEEDIPNSNPDSDLSDAKPEEDKPDDNGWGQFFNGSNSGATEQETSSGDNDDALVIETTESEDPIDNDATPTQATETQAPVDNNEPPTKVTELPFPLDTDLAVPEIKTLNNHEAWVKEGLEPIFWALKPSSATEGEKAYLRKLQHHFKFQLKGRSLDKDVVYGRKIDPVQFTEILIFNQKLLEKKYPGHHIYSTLDSYKAHVASIAPDLLQIETNKYQSFVDFQNAILDKYPQPPKEEDKEEFFTKTLPENLKINLVSLMEVAINSNPSLALSVPLKASFQEALEASEYKFFEQEKALMKNDSKYNQEITELVERQLTPLTQELLLNRLINLIWENANIKNSVTTSDHRRSTITGDVLTTTATGVKTKPELESINLLAADPEWLKFISFYTNQMIDIEVLAGLQIGTKARLLTAIERFTRTQPSEELNPTQLNILCGIDKPTNSQEDQKLLRDFINFIGADSNEALAKFPERLSIINQQEAIFLVKNAFKGIDAKGLNPKLSELTKSAVANPELIAEFLSTRDPDALLNPSEIKNAVRLIQGDAELFADGTRKASSQAYLRSYLDFLERKKLVKLNDIVAAFPKLTGIIDKDELVAATKKNLDIKELTKDYRARSDGNLIERTTELEECLGLNINDMALIAELKDPLQFYAQALALISEAIMDSSPGFINKPITLKKGSDILLARSFLKTIWGDEYTYQPEKKQIATVSEYILDGANAGITMKMFFYENKVVVDFREGKGATEKSLEQFTCNYKDEVWQMEPQASTEDGARKKIGKYHKNANWFKKLFESKDSSYLTLLAAMDNFVTSQEEYKLHINDDEARKKYLANLYSILLGDETVINLDKAKNTQIFRDWIAYLRIDLNEVIAEYPKLTGVRDLDELKLFVDKSYPDIELKKMGLNLTKISFEKLKRIIKDTIIPNSGLAWEEVDEFKDHQALIDLYKNGVINNPGIENSQRVWREANYGHKEKNIEYLPLAFKLFPQYDLGRKILLLLDKSQAELGILNDVIEYTTFVADQDHEQIFLSATDSIWNAETKTWQHKTYNEDSLFVMDLIMRNKDNASLYRRFNKAISDSFGIVKVKPRWFFSRLIDDFFAQIQGEYSTSIVANAILGTEKIFKSNDPVLVENGFVTLKSFIDFAAKTYPHFAEITDDELKRILGILVPIESAIEQARKYIFDQGEEHWLAIQGQLPLKESFEQEMKQFNVTIKDLFESLGIEESHFTETLPEGINVVANHPNIQTDIHCNPDALKILAILNKIFPTNPRIIIPLVNGKYNLSTNAVDDIKLLQAGIETPDQLILNLQLLNGEWVRSTNYSFDSRLLPEQNLKNAIQIQYRNTIQQALNHLLGAKNLLTTVASQIGLTGIYAKTLLKDFQDVGSLIPTSKIRDKLISLGIPKEFAAQQIENMINNKDWRIEIQCMALLTSLLGDLEAPLGFKISELPSGQPVEIYCTGRQVLLKTAIRPNYSEDQVKILLDLRVGQ